MANTIEINGISAEQVYDTVRSAGVADADAKLLVSNWIYQNYLTLARTFSYVTPFPAAVPACVPDPFARTFVHKDWVDGEDLVQAGLSATDEGFNARFHHIETDLDSLGQKIASVADCMADMRESLSSLLAEVAAELNRIDADIAEIRGPVVVKPPVYTGGLLTGQYANQVASQYVVPNYSGPAPSGSQGDPLVNYLGTTVFQDKAVSLFNTSQGVMIMPAVDVSTPSNVDLRVGAAGAVARAFEENSDLSQATRQAVSKSDLVQRFGDLSLSNGQTLKQALAVLPVNAQYENAQAMISDIAQRSAGALQSTTGLAKQLATTVNAPAEATSFSTVDVSGLKSLPPAAAADLRKAGIGTIGQFAAATPATVTKLLGRAATGLSAGEILAVHGMAQTLSNLQIE